MNQAPSATVQEVVRHKEHGPFAVTCSRCGKPYTVNRIRARRRLCRSCCGSLAPHFKGQRLPARREVVWETTQDTATCDLGEGLILKISRCDLEMMQGFHWWHKKNCRTHYARTVVLIDGRWRWVYAHHLIAGYPLGGNEIDHFDRNGLNNHRSNLRVATKAQNRQNSIRPCRSGARGVRKHGQRFVAACAGVRVSFETHEEAVAAYDQMAVENYGPLALTNARLGFASAQEAQQALVSAFLSATASAADGRDR